MLSKTMLMKQTFARTAGVAKRTTLFNRSVSSCLVIESDNANAVVVGTRAVSNAAQKPSKMNVSKITKRSENYSQWYLDTIKEADMVDTSPTRGCLIYKPWGMNIWESIKEHVDIRIKQHDVSPAYFPLLIPTSFLSKEAQHVDGFAKECAVVTHHRLCEQADGSRLIPDPVAKLEEPLIIRPTSETVIWHSFSRWIHSYRDLPLKINQWCNVLRWEMKTRPFLRSSEFLWQEGHTAHSSKEEALKMTHDALDMYGDMCKELLAFPVIKGLKSPSERFAGADETLTIEALMQNGWALQSGTSHFLGQNFGKAFDVKFQSKENNLEHVWGSSWGVSTRLVGATIMSHSDDNGLVLPPHIAPIQVIIVPILSKGNELRINNAIDALVHSLKLCKIRVQVDDRSDMRPGSKFYEWERKGVPLRISIGGKEIDNGSVECIYRNNGTKHSLNINEIVQCDNKNLRDVDVLGIGNKVKSMLQEVHELLYTEAQNRLHNRMCYVNNYSELKELLQLQKTSSSDNNGVESETECGNNAHPSFFLVPWNCHSGNEQLIKDELKLTIRCYPFAYNKHIPLSGKSNTTSVEMEPKKVIQISSGSLVLPAITENCKCFYSNETATHIALFARAY